MQRAAADDVHDLHAATDPEQRLVALQRAPHEGELERVTLRYDAHCLGVWRRSVGLRTDVDAADEQQPVEAVEGPKSGALSREEKDANEAARVWFRGIQTIVKRVGVKAVYDLSATPFYLSGSGYNEGYIFPWTVSDFSLMDAIESGIVKIPRTPVDDDATGDLVTYLRLWDHIGDKLPKRKVAATAGTEGWIPPPELEGALNSL